MSGERRAIEHPLWIDFSGRPVPPLKFVLQTTYSPIGVVERPSPGVISSHTPWYTEVALELTGTETIAVLYLMPKDDESVLLAACLDNAFERFFTFLSGADFGDGVTALTAQQWPDVYAMLLRSNDHVAGGRVLANVATPRRVQWVVADHLHASQVDNIASEQLLDLIRTSARTFLRAIDPPLELRGFIQAIGGPDRSARQRKALTGLLGAGSDIGELLDGGVGADELRDLGRAALDAVSNMLALKADR